MEGKQQMKKRQPYLMCFL